MKSGMALLVTALLAVAQPAWAQQRQQRAPTPQAPPPVVQPAPPPVEVPGPAYEARLLRLAEILGALTYMVDLCQTSAGAASGSEGWRSRMRELMEAEGQTPVMKERLAGAYNRGITGYRASYRVCTPSGRLAIERMLGEGAALAHDLAGRYGS